MTGDLRLESLVIDPDAVDPEDVEMLQDMVVAAVNEAIRMAEELQQTQLGGAETGGFDPMSALESLGLGGGALGGLGGGGGLPRPRRRRRAQPRRAPRRQEEVALARPAPPAARHRAGEAPGVGNRTAQRLAFHVLRESNEDALALAQAIRDVKEKITLCEICFNLAEGPRCVICLDERRDTSVICVVEEPGDVIPIERTHEFRGRYHVLGGALSPIDGVEPEDLRLGQLYGRVDRRRGPRGRAGHQPDDHGRGDRAAHRWRAARAHAGRRGHAPRLRAAGRRRPGVRRRGDARARVLGPPRP